MNIRDIHIHQKVYDKNNNICEVADIYTTDNQTLNTNEWFRDTTGKIHAAADAQPITDRPYLITDQFGNQNFCIECEAGTLTTDFDTVLECGYTAAYIALKPKDLETPIDLMMVKNPEATKDLTLRAFANVYQEDHTHEFNIEYNDILDAQGFPDKKSE